MSFIRTTENGSIEIDARDVFEAKIALRELKFQKKAIATQKKEVNEQMREVRAAYTDTVRRRNVKFIGGGFVGKIIRGAQTINSNSVRQSLEATLEPYEQQKQWLENISIAIDKSILMVDAYISQNG